MVGHEIKNRASLRNGSRSSDVTLIFKTPLGVRCNSFTYRVLIKKNDFNLFVDKQ